MRPSPLLSLNALPLHLWARVLTFLPFEEVVPASYASKRLHEAANDNAVWHQLYIGSFGSATPTNRKRPLAEIMSHNNGRRKSSMEQSYKIMRRKRPRGHAGENRPVPSVDSLVWKSMFKAQFEEKTRDINDNVGNIQDMFQEMEDAIMLTDRQRVEICVHFFPRGREGSGGSSGAAGRSCGSQAFC
eukprot:Selendium_serpulae@DN5666_c0_g1_i4.p1